MISGNKLRYVYFCIGEGRNGKSLFIKMLKKMFSIMVKPVSKDIVIQNKNKSSITTELEKLDKIRIGFISELKEDDNLNVVMLKAISGDDEIDVRKLFKTNEEILPTANMLYATNEMPKFKVEKAFVERFVVIPFNNEFEIDTSFEDKLIENIDYIFSYIMIYGNIRDKFNYPDVMKLATNEYVAINDNDTLKDYINTYIEKNIPETDVRSEWCIKRNDLIMSYNKYCMNMGFKDRRTTTAFTRYITKLGINNVESNSILWFKNIQYKEMDEENNNFSP
jgi:phage/plasmid-associated DNA primase